MTASSPESLRDSFSASADRSACAAETSLRPGDAAALAISDEPANGSAQPTTKRVYVGPVGD